MSIQNKDGTLMSDLDFEEDFWGDCTNTFGEDAKHFIYARGMYLTGHHYSLDANNKKILDIGGGPTSMLLKTYNLKEGLVCDPIDYPQWTKDRYKTKNINVKVIPGEEVDETNFDEVWIYNCMQHSQNPELILRNAFKAAPVIRLFEWINIPPHEGHPQMLTIQNLLSYMKPNLDQSKFESKTYNGENGCYGDAFHGVFIRGQV